MKFLWSALAVSLKIAQWVRHSEHLVDRQLYRASRGTHVPSHTQRITLILHLNSARLQNREVTTNYNNYFLLFSIYRSFFGHVIAGYKSSLVGR